MITNVTLHVQLVLVVRKLQEFESPYLSLKAANKHGVHRIVLRKGQVFVFYLLISVLSSVVILFIIIGFCVLFIN